MSRFLLPVADYMSSPVASVSVSADLGEAERLLRERNVSSLAVLEHDGRLAGVISRTDLLRVGRLRSSMGGSATLLTLPRMQVRERMVGEVVWVDPETPAAAAAALMVARHIHRVFVVDREEPIGVFSTRDCMRAVVDERVAAPLSQVMSHPVLTVEATERISRATDMLDEAHVRGLIVVDNEWPVGIFTQGEALAARAHDPGLAVEEVMNAALLCLPETLPLFRAAQFALATRARRILAVEARHMRGVVSGIDFARVVGSGHA